MHYAFDFGPLKAPMDLGVPQVFKPFSYILNSRVQLLDVKLAYFRVALERF
jgi:hypothetical protein